MSQQNISGYFLSKIIKFNVIYFYEIAKKYIDKSSIFKKILLKIHLSRVRIPVHQ